jgi:hypothetical protein
MHMLPRNKTVFTLPSHHGASLPFCTGTAHVFASTVNTSSARREGAAASHVLHHASSALADCDTSSDAAEVAATVTATVTFSVPLVHAVNWGSHTVWVMLQV